ncbi:MAG: hypothetical protein ACREH4_07785 [Vitreimonas sp.]
MTTTEKPARREKRTNVWIGATSVSLLVYAGFIALSVMQPWAVWIAILAAAAAVAVVFAVFWMASLDEAAQQAHYVAWYWGGSAGLVVSMLVFLALMPQMLRPEGLAGAFAVVPGMTPASVGFLAGLLLGVVPAVLGDVIWWIALWRRRG